MWSASSESTPKRTILGCFVRRVAMSCAMSFAGWISPRRETLTPGPSPTLRERGEFKAPSPCEGEGRDGVLRKGGLFVVFADQTEEDVFKRLFARARP